jgi:hypothetical protein
MSDEDRFWANVEKTESCWVWTAGRFTEGYGGFRVDGRTRRAHRVAYELLIGPIAHGLVLDHLCGNPSCVNPAHLEPVTNRLNVLRGSGHTAVNARKTHCIHGHEFTPQNTYRDRRAKRHCVECGRIRSREHQRRLRAER